MIAHVGMVIGLVGFCLCASQSVCQGQQGDIEGRNEQAARACAFLIVLAFFVVGGWLS